MKTMLRVALSILVPAAQCPLPAAAAGGEETLAKAFSPTEIAVSYRPAVDADGKCPKDAKISADAAAECRKRVQAEITAYLGATPETAPLNDFEKSYIAMHPVIAKSGSRSNFMDFAGGIDDSQGNGGIFLRKLRGFIRHDLRAYLETGKDEIAFLPGFVDAAFKKPVDLAAATTAIDKRLDEIYVSVLDEFKDLEGAVLTGAYDTEEKRQAFRRKALGAALEGPGSRRAFLTAAREEIAKTIDGTREAALDESAATVEGMLGGMNMAVIRYALKDDYDKKFAPAIAAANEKAKKGDKKEALALAKKLHAVVKAETANYRKPQSSKDHLALIKRLGDLALDENKSAEESFKLVSDQFSGGKAEEGVVAGPDGKKTPNLTVEKGKGLRTEEPVPSPEDKEDADPAAAKKKEMDNMKRNMIAAAYGAAGFGMIGLVLGGPFGFVIGAALGGALMAGINQLKNNPIGK